MIKNLRQLKGNTFIHFLRELKTKNWSRGSLDCLLVKIGRTGSVDHVADSGINDRLVKLPPLINQTCFEFIDVSNFDENADENLSTS